MTVARCASHRFIAVIPFPDIPHTGVDEKRMLWNLAGCMLARIDGKSPVEYLAASQQALVRQLARDWILQPPATLGEAIWRAAERVVP